MYLIAKDPEKYFHQYNTVFLGKIESTEKPAIDMQIAGFKVLKVFKGNVSSKIQIINTLKNDCSTFFVGPGSKYYVFGNISQDGTEIDLDGFPSFVSEYLAQEQATLEKLLAITR